MKRSRSPKSGLLGKTAPRAYWLNAGFAKGSPSACNTWKAPKSKVACHATAAMARPEPR
ncbi:hypothetical protein [Sinosporangium siamense]|uniref:Uncharacterized protein n=1 Tax=Sinosporangium siamense TaxID=1367973 RepID=A0A919RF14_9ACTN|nr:hypothetical protein [Sinosporangium siamense]GII92438.1 hypothetical protein Ssi02_26690 [Sinosporangium siamense]